MAGPKAAWRDDLACLGRARLLVVAARHAPPATWDALEDPSGKASTRSRSSPAASCSAVARRRAPAVLDGDGLLSVPRWLVGGRVLTGAAGAGPAKVRPGSLVSRAELLDAARPGVESDETRALDRVIRRLRLRLAPLGVRAHTVRGSGFPLDMGELPG